MKLQYVGWFDEYYVYMMAIILFVANVKFIRLLRFNNRFSQLILTLKTCWEDLSGFLAIFFLVFFAFVQLFYMILQSNMKEFHSIVASLETCFTMMLNKFKFGNMKETSMTAAVMFFFFAVSCTWILLNVLLTIIIEAFEKVKEELNAKGNQYEILDFIKTQSKYRIGTMELPPKDNAFADELTKERKNQDEAKEGLEGSDDDGDDENDSNVVELPKKVDAFLVYINDMYFDGELDIEGKRMFREELMDNGEGDFNGSPSRVVLNSDGNNAMKSPYRKRVQFQN